MPIINPTLPNDGETIDASDINNPLNAILGVLNGQIDNNNIAPGGITLSNLASALTPFLVPSGVFVPFAGASAPTGWLLCDGSSLLRSSYPALFGAIGTFFGSADGTHFNVPDLRGRIPVGREAMGGTTSGRIERSTTISTTSGSPTTTVGSATKIANGMVVVAAGVPANTTVVSVSGTTVTLSANATATASSVAARFSLLGADPEVLGASGGEDAHTLTTPELASHSHIIPTGGGGGAGIYEVPGPGFSSYDYTPATPTTNTGSDQAHNIMQPSLISNYIIKT